MYWVLPESTKPRHASHQGKDKSTMQLTQSTSTCHLMATLWVELGEEEGALARMTV